ncbi:hypothetical protein I4U23_011631 [Adineta vaga]|nr:hypothetical protein I4U23_011631 [Adineta vaga]
MVTAILSDRNILSQTRDTEGKLRSIIDHCQKFHDLKQCQEYIENKSEKDRLIPLIHNL